jgi:outer membrane protein TolC
MASPIRGVFVWLFIARAAHADPAELRLDEVIAVAVRQSPELERARIDVDAARAELLRSEGIEDTHVGVAANRTVNRVASNDPTGNSDSSQIAISAQRTLPTGGTLSIVAADNRTQSPQPVRTGVDDNGNPTYITAEITRSLVSLGVGVIQPLLRGAGSTAFEAPIRRAAQQRDAAVLNREARARDHLVALAQAYWQVAFTRRQLEVRKTSLDLAQQQLHYTEGAIRAEKVARSELLAVQEALAIRQQDVIAAEQDVVERSLALRQLGGLEIGPDALEVRTEVLPLKIDAGDIDVGAVVRAAFERSAELAALEASRRAAETSMAAADGAARPRLDLSLDAAAFGAGNGARYAASQLVENPGYSVIAGLTFDHAIEHRSESGGQAAARAALAKARVDEREARARLGVRATRAVQRATAALARISLGEQAIALADQSVTAEQARFQLGKTTNFEVLRRQDELEQARLRHAGAIADYLAARADLDGLSGAILARYHIVMQ